MSWVEEEFKTVDLGDKRLNSRVIHIIETLGLSPGRTIPQSFKSWGEIKACYNFTNNDLVTNEKLLAPHKEKTLERIREYPVVLFLSDTTDINYTSKLAMSGKERLSNKQNGIWLHPTIAVTPEKLCLGIVDANFWHRQPEVKNALSATARLKTPLKEKESYRWLLSYKNACEVAREVRETQIINITDREGDIIEIFENALEQEKQGHFAYFIIRSQHNRCLESDEQKKIQSKLWRRLKEADSIGEVEFTLSPTDDRKGRMVKQQLKAVNVTLRSENDYKKSIKVKVNAVMAIEEQPPEGEEALVWIFVTNLPINDFENVCKIIKYYLCRWQIELFFKVLKSGCKIEERQLQTTDRMKNLITVFMLLSWRILFTMMLGRVHSDMSTEDVFEAAEWKAVYKIVNDKKPLPRKPPRLGEFIVLIGILGGYVNTKSAEPPGVKTMWKGMARMVDFAIAWEAFGR